MNAHLTITEVSNIDWDKRAVIDEAKIEKKIIDWDDKITIAFGDRERSTIKMSRVSLYDNILVLEEKKYKILHMLSK